MTYHLFLYFRCMFPNGLQRQAGRHVRTMKFVSITKRYVTLNRAITTVGNCMLLATECCASSLKACLATGGGSKHHSYSLLNGGMEG